MSENISNRDALKRLFLIILLLLSQILFYSCSRTQNPFLISYPHKYRHLISTISTQYISYGKTIRVDLSNYFLFDITDIRFLPNHFINVNISDNKKIIELSTDLNENRLEFLDFMIQGESGIKLNGIILVRLMKGAYVTFKYSPDKQVKEVFLAGSFNNLNNKEYRLTDLKKDNTYAITIPLNEGQYEYRYFVDGEWIIDPSNLEKSSDGYGGFNSIINVGSGDLIKRTKIIRYFKYVDKDKVIHFVFKFISAFSDMDENSIKIMVNNQLLSPAFYKGFTNFIDLEIPRDAEDSAVIRINAKDKEKNLADESTFILNDENRNSTDWDTAIAYYLLIDRFYNGDKENDNPIKDEELDVKLNFNGGDFRGISDKINEGYFDELGINAIVLSPVNKQPESAYKDSSLSEKKSTGYNGYWQIEPRQTEPKFGSIKDLQNLIEIAHKHNIRILLNYIPNYTHIEHPYYKDHPDWYNPVDLPDGKKNIRLFDEFPFTTWFDTFLPSFDFINNSDVLEQITNDVIWWIKTSYADGLYVTNTNYIPHNYFKKLTNKIKGQVEKSSEKKILQIGDSNSSMENIKEYINFSEIDGQLDYPLYAELIKTFANECQSFILLDKFLNESLRVYNFDSMIFNILNSKDVARFMAFADDDIENPDLERIKELGLTHTVDVNNPESYEKLKSAFAFLFTIPGVPMIYYGDEIGMTGAGEPDNQCPMRFGEDVTPFEKGVFEYISFLCKLRKNHPVLTEKDFFTLYVSDDCYVYLRSGFAEKIIVVLNKFINKKRVKFRFPFDIKDNSLLQNLSSSELNPIRNNECNFILYPRRAEFYILKENILGFNIK